jgi:hypothetical protein
MKTDKSVLKSLSVYISSKMEDRGQVIYFLSVRIPEVEIFFSSTGNGRSGTGDLFFFGADT